ncbi:MAG: menaquinone biosynthesis protein [Chitinophagaceae bacterium]
MPQRSFTPIPKMGGIDQMTTESKIRVGAVSYLNTKPLIYGFEQGMMSDQVELVNDYPSRIARMLLLGEIDIGLVPVAIIPQLKESYIITDCCIGSVGPVASVCLFSEVPLQQVRKVLLDYQSRSSVALTRILINEYWKINPELADAREDFRNHIKGTTAGLVIGDRALEQRNISPYIYDLGQSWKELTGLPFVFAAWVSNKRLDDDFVQLFIEANKYGLKHIDDVVSNNRTLVFDLKKYYTQFISYSLDDLKKKGMELFLQKIAAF